MGLSRELLTRSGSKCELCGSSNDLDVYEVDGGHVKSNQPIVTCETCRDQLNDDAPIQANHWRCLNDSMWSEVPAVQVTAFRMLTKLKSEGWPQDLLDMLYMDDETREWAEAGGETGHVDCNGVPLKNGDTVVLIQTLTVKGSSAAAKRGYAVRNISLVHDNPEQIEGKIEGQQLVITTKFVKKR